MLKNDLKGILRDTDRLIDEKLGNHKHGTVGKALTQAPQNFSSKKLLEKMITRIEDNLKEARDTSSGIVLGKSVENWREESPTQKHDERKPERDLEHRLVIANGNDSVWNWWNQMPIASGLVGHRADRTRAIDIVCNMKTKSTHYRLIELKVNRGAGAPLAALMEIVRYGLVYFVLRKNQKCEWLKGVSFDAPIFTADQIDLCVLAPKNYYEGYELAWLEKDLTSALKKIIKDQLGDGLEMNLSSYWPTGLNKNSDLTPDELKSYLAGWTKAFTA